MGRYRFAPEALDDASPYIDRIEVECEGVHLQHLSPQHIAAFMQELGAGSFFNAPYLGACEIRRRRWLVGGHVRAVRSSADGGGIRLKISLTLNLTRFLQAHRVPTSAQMRESIEQDPSESLSRRRPQSLLALEEASELTLDRKENFLTHTPVTYGRLFHWDVRLREYLVTVFAAIENEIDRVSRRMVGRLPRVRLQEAEWYLKQCECYYEFAVGDAIGKVAAVSHTVRNVLRDSYVSDFPPREGSERNAPYVSGRLDHADIRAKLYAKSSGVVRFELAYDRSPLAATREAGILASRGNLDHLIHMVTVVSADASERSSRFWRQFWRRHDTGGPASPVRVVLFFKTLASVSSPAINMVELLSLLLLQDGAEPFTVGRSASDPIRKLVRAGILERASENRRRVRYIISPRYRSLVAELRRFLATSEPEEVGLLPDEDPPLPGRVRLLTRSFEERGDASPVEPPRRPRERNRRRRPA